MINLHYQQQLWGIYANRASQIVTDAIKEAIPQIFPLDRIVYTANNVADRVRVFSDEYTQLQSPMEISVQGRNTMISLVEVIAHQSRDYTEVPQDMHPQNHVNAPMHQWGGYNPMIDARKPRPSNIYGNGPDTRSRQIYEARQRKKPNRGPVQVHGGSKRGRQKGHPDQPNQMGRRTHISFVRYSRGVQ